LKSQAINEKTSQKIFVGYFLTHPMHVRAAS